MNLMSDLHWLSKRWVEEHGRRNPAISLKTLGSRTVGDAKLFPRLACGRPIAVPTLERVIKYLADEASWPGPIPNDVQERLALAGAPVAGVRVYVEREVVERKLVVRA